MTSNPEPTRPPSSVAPAAAWTGRRLALVAAVVALEAVALDARTLANGFSWDDEVWLTAEGRGCPDGLLSCLRGPNLVVYHRPLTALTFELHERLGLPPAAWAHHLENLALRALFAAGLVLLLSRFASVWAVALASQVAVVHPLSATAVAWLGARPDLLSLLFVTLHLAALDVAVRGARRRWYAAALLALVAAILSKEQSALALVASVSLVLARTPAGRRRWPAVAVLCATAVSVGALVLPQASATVETGWTLLERARVVGWTVSAFSAALVLPDVDLLHTFVLVDAPGVTLRGLVGLVALVAVGWAGRAAPGARVGAALVVTSLLPVVNLVPLGSMLFAAYRAIPCLTGLSLLVACWLDLLQRRLSKAVLTGTMVVFVALLAPTHLEELVAWADHDSASAYAVDAAPDDLFDRVLLVRRLRERGQTERALALMHEGFTRFAPDAGGDPERLAALPADVLRARAILHYKPSSADGMRPVLGRFLALEGLLLDELGRVDEARRWYAAALSLVELSPIRKRLEALDVAAREQRPPPAVPRGLQTG